MLILLLFLLAIMALVGVKYPTWFVVIYIIASSKFLGFGDMGAFLFNGTDVGFFSINILTLLLASVSVRNIKLPRDIASFAIAVTILLIWGLIAPYALGYQSFQQSVFASKGFLSFSLLIYIFVHGAKIDTAVVFNLCKFIGVYLACVYILNIVFGVSPPNYKTIDQISSRYYRYYSNIEVLRVFYPTFISLAAFLFFFDRTKKRLSNIYYVSVSSILLIGLQLSGFEALTVTTIVGLIALHVFYRERSGFSMSRAISRGILVILLAFATLLVFDGVRDTLKNRVEAIVYQTDSALVSRERYNEFRWRAISDRPLLGYGFLHKSSPKMREFEMRGRSRFTESLGVIDSGYVDLLSRFGYLGTAFYLFSFGYLMFAVFFRGQSAGKLDVIIGVFLLQYYMVNFTWSVFSFPHGIIPLSIGIMFILSARRSELRALYPRSSIV